VADCSAEELACDDIFCLAEPSGLGAPYFRKDIGLTFSAPVEGLPQQRIAALLLEAIVFRVARMLEDLQLEFGVERVYLSGGLSNLSCLQQGIARCAPFADVYLLPQPDAGLIGVARVAAGMIFSVEYGTVERGAGKMVIIRAPLRLAEKYARWKLWLDGLLIR
jgi:glycerol kinase